MKNILHLENILNTLHKTKLLLAAVGALCAMPAWASDVPMASPVTANITIANNYLFRGLSRTNTMPAVQGGVDLAADNGLYVGAWGSNVSWLADQGSATTSSLELDAYAGVKNTFLEDFNYDFGLVHYHFPAVYAAGAVNADTNELHAALTYSWLAVKYSYAVGNAFGVANSTGSNYLDISARFPVNEQWVLGAHVGKQTYKGVTAEALRLGGMDPSYRDWQLSVAWKPAGAGWELGLALTGTNVPDAGYYTNTRGINLGRKATLFTVRRTF